jgi:hypothetical protein
VRQRVEVALDALEQVGDALDERFEQPASSVGADVHAAGERSTNCMKRLTGVGSA